MNLLLWNILLAGAWGAATGQITVANLAFGYVLGYLILRFAQRTREPTSYFEKVPQVFRFALFYFGQLLKSNLRVAYDVVVPGAWTSPDPRRVAPPRPDPDFLGPHRAALSSPENLRAPLSPWYPVRPGVIGIPLDARTDREIALLANLITLTPGSVALDLSEDNRVLYVHLMYIDDGDVDAARRNIKENLERRVLELLR